MIRHLKILAWIHVVMGGGLLLVGIALLVGVFFEPDYRHTLPFLFGLFLWLAIGLFIPSLTGGIGLLRQKGWARILMSVLSVECLLGFPVGTALGVYGLWALAKPESSTENSQSSPSVRRALNQPKGP